VRWLLQEGLLDELQLLLYPLVLGTGKRLFEESDDQVQLELVESRTLDNGVVALTYRPRGK
jgi:dihydrofolate reductase